MLCSSVFLVSVPPGQTLPSTTPAVNASPSSSTAPHPRSEQIPKLIRTNRPTVNSLMHLYGPWILDACLLQTKDRYTRSSTVVNASDGNSAAPLTCEIKLLLSLASRVNEIDKTLDAQVCRRFE